MGKFCHSYNIKYQGSITSEERLSKGKYRDSTRVRTIDFQIFKRGCVNLLTIERCSTALDTCNQM